MNAERLLAHFDRLADAPDSVPRLRRFILDLAVRGKLVEQNLKDEPACVLLTRLLAENASGNGARKKKAAVAAIEDSDTPFPAPTGWLWIRFGSIHELVRGVTYTKSDVSENEVAGYLPILRANNIGATLNFEDLVYVRENCISPGQMLHRGDYLIALSSGSKNLVGKAAFVAADFSGGFGGFCGVIRLVSTSLEKFVGVFLSSRLYREAISAGSRGIGINNLKRETLNGILFPLPPLAEQRRIVAKVEELMSLCDRLEAAQAERESRRDRLASASLHCLNEPAEDATAFRDDARLVLDHLARFTTRPEHIPQLRQTILNLAVRGKLVLQDPKDGDTSALMRQILAERVSSADAGNKKLAPLSNSILTGEHLFDIPTTWEWVRATDLCFSVVSGSTPPPEIFETTAGVPFLKVYNIREQRIDFEYKQQFVSHSYHSTKLKRSILHPGDVVMNIVGPPLGKTAIIPDSHPEWNCNQAITAFRPALPSMTAYLYTFFKEGSFLRNIELIGTAGQDNISVTKCRNIPVPLPPLAEQHRIVAKVDELMTLCDRLEAQFTKTRTEGRRFLEAVLHEALVPVA
jgi:type I restriction enzyme S subunit